MEMSNDHSLDEYENQSDVCSFLLHAALELENVDSDDEYENQSDDETEDEDEDEDEDEGEDDDNEKTIEEEDEVKTTEVEMKEEVVALKAEADLHLGEILKAYPEMTIRCFRIAMLLLITLFFTSVTTTPLVVMATGFQAGSNTLEITDYSILKKVIMTGNCIQSDIFTVSGYQWVIEFYPQGRDYSSFDFISIGVRLINPTNVVQAMSTHRFHDWNTSTWSTQTRVDSNVYTFTRRVYYRIKRSDFETSSYLRNDTLVIKTNLWVVKDISWCDITSNQWNLANADRCFF